MSNITTTSTKSFRLKVALTRLFFGEAAALKLQPKLPPQVNKRVSATAGHTPRRYPKDLQERAKQAGRTPEEQDIYENLHRIFYP